MLRILHTHREVVVEGTRVDLRDLRAAVLALAMKGQRPVTIRAETDYDPAPYDRVLSAVILDVGDGPTDVAVSADGQLRISASRDNLLRLASFADVPDRALAGWHSHYEHFAGNEFILASAEPLMFSLRG